MKVGIFGAGFSGREIGRQILATGIPVWGTTRNEENFAALNDRGVRPVLFDGDCLTEEIASSLEDTTHLIVSIAPPRDENVQAPDSPVDPVLISFADQKLKSIAPKLEWIGYLSTVGVYGDHDGAWIDENTAPAPTSERSRQRARAEAEWLAVGEALNLPVGVFRLSGIYGPGRNALVNADKGTSRRLVKKDQVFNRIHVRDIAKALALAARQKAAGLLNITDDEPAPPQDVVAFAHALMGTEAPPEIEFETADISPMARSFYGENKRVSNAKSKQMLGVEYTWPNYRVALKRMWDENTWRG